MIQNSDIILTINNIISLNAAFVFDDLSEQKHSRSFSQNIIFSNVLARAPSCPCCPVGRAARAISCARVAALRSTAVKVCPKKRGKSFLSTPQSRCALPLCVAEVSVQLLMSFLYLHKL